MQLGVLWVCAGAAAWWGRRGYTAKRQFVTSGAPLYLRRGAGPAVGQCLGPSLALCQRPLDPHAGRGVGPALASARGGAARLAERQRHSQPPTVARPERAGALCLGAGTPQSDRLLRAPPPFASPAPPARVRPSLPRRSSVSAFSSLAA